MVEWSGLQFVEAASIGVNQRRFWSMVLNRYTSYHEAIADMRRRVLPWEETGLKI